MLPVGAALLLGWRPRVPCRPGGPALATLSTMVFAAIVLAQMANAFEGRSTVTSLRPRPGNQSPAGGGGRRRVLALLGFVYLGPM
jgi:hypothetical protein